MLKCVLDVGFGHNRWYVLGLFSELMNETHDVLESLAIAEMFQTVPPPLRQYAIGRISLSRVHPLVIAALSERNSNEL